MKRIPCRFLMRLPQRAVICVLVTAVAASLIGRVEAATAADLARGCSLLQMHNWSEARRAFTAVLGQDVQCVEAAAGIATCDLYTGDVASARKRFEGLVVVAPRSVAAHAGLALCQYATGDAASAVREYRLASAVNADPVLGQRLRAGVSFLEACEGLYQGALQDAVAALQADPGDGLALYVQAACLYATGKPAEALAALPVQADAAGPASSDGMMASSCLFAPGTRYYADSNLGDDTRLAQLAQEGVRTAVLPLTSAPTDDTGTGPAGGPTSVQPGGVAPASTTGDGVISITYPRPGTSVRGSVEVMVNESGKAQVDYIAVLLDQEFAGITNARPFRVVCDTRHAGDGAREIRVDAYGLDGSIVGHAETTINVQNGNRTLADTERETRAAAARATADQLMLQVPSLLGDQLAGACLRKLGRVPEAATAFETAFSFAPDMAGVRTDLLSTYADMGLLQAVRVHEVHSLPARAGRSVALTFDDGPHPIITPFILDLLDRYHAKATFFLVGKQVELYPDLARDIVRRGHAVGVHGYTHSNLRRLDQLGVERELVKARAAIRDACGFRALLFRPPGGNYNEAVRRATASCGFIAVFWNANITHYPGWTGEAIQKALINRLRDGGIVLLHNGEDETPQTLPLLLPALRAKGCRLDTVPTLAGMPQWKEGGQ